MTDEVLIERTDGVLLITLNRPDARNAMTLAMAERIGGGRRRPRVGRHLVGGGHRWNGGDRVLCGNGPQGLPPR